MNTQSKILITGATGFLGSYLLKFLVESGFKHIFALCRAKQSNTKSDERAVTWIEGDLLDFPFIEDATQGIDFVFHCAAVVSYNEADREIMYETNITGTEYLVNACLSNEVKKLIFVSSIAAIGRSENGVIIDENTPWSESKYNTPYGKSKHLAEREVWRGMAEGMRVTIVNPSVIVGAGNWENGSPKLFKTVAEGLRYFPSGATGFVDVRDVVSFMVKAMDASFDNERYILNGANISWKQFFQSVAKGLGVTPPSIQAGKLTSLIAPYAAWIKSKLTGERAFITKDTIATSSRVNSYDSRKSQQQEFSYRSIDHTIAETASSYLSRTTQLLDF